MKTANKKDKRTSTKIKQEILDFLKDGPSSIKKICENTKSNWATANNYLNELRKQGKISELISSGNLKIFRRTDDPVFYGIPLSKKIRGETLFILLKIAEKWKEKKKQTIPKTTLQKIAVDVIHEKKLNLPVLDFHFGKVTALSIETDKDFVNAAEYYKEYPIIAPKKSREILIEIDKQVNKHTSFAWKERLKQYENYKMRLYQAKEDLLRIFRSGDSAKIEDAILRISLEYPINIQNENIFELLDKFTSASVILLNSEEKEKYIEDIRECFDSLWDLLTMKFYFKGIKEFIEKNKLDLFEEMQNFHINSKLMKCSELVSELRSNSHSIDIDKIKIPEDAETKQVMSIFLEGIEEE